MTTENLNSENPEKENLEQLLNAENTSSEEIKADNVKMEETETVEDDSAVEVPEEKLAADTETLEVAVEEEAPEVANDTNLETSAESSPQDITHAEEDAHDELHDEIISKNAKQLSEEEIVKQLEDIVNKENAGSHYREFNHLREELQHKIHEDQEYKKEKFVEAGNAAENFVYENKNLALLGSLSAIFKEKQDVYHKNQEEEHHKNLEHRQNIIERLKNLYTNTEVGTNLFSEIRKIKEDWANAGQVAKNEFRNLNNNYFHHLNGFYQMLDLNKEYREQEYAHNLEKRQHIIARAKELENEPVVQKALNELQFLHKLWKEEAEPVAEEFRDKTWEEFKEISNKIHERKQELLSQIEEEQKHNLERKNAIIDEIKKLTSPEKANHNFWQNAIKKVEDLRTEFLKMGSVPKKLSNQNWTDFKQTLRNFNSSKNDFYKNLKGSQVDNLEKKLALIKSAQDNMNSEDWETAVPLFKKLQEEWKNIGHVPRSHTNKVWDDFREACNTFFKNYREKNNALTDDWKHNFKLKKELLEELKNIGEEEGSIEKIEHIKTSWNNIGKVPRDKMSINTEFNKTLREKLKINKINEFDLKEEGLSETQLTDKARKIKNQIADLEAEIVKLENNVGFFSNPSRENPLLKDTFDKIDDKKAQLESLKHTLHNIISGE